MHVITKEFLKTKENIYNNEQEETYFINTSHNKAYKFFKFIYENSTIYLNRNI